MTKPQGAESNIIIFCSDPRVVRLLKQEKIAKQLSIDVNYSAIAETGSIKFFMHEDLMDKLYKQLEILVEHFAPEKIIILNHTDCRYYKSIGEDKEENYLQDIKDAKDDLGVRFSNVKIEGWLINTESGELKEVR